jgi:hypothetical protein
MSNEEQVKRLAEHFNKDVNYYETISYDSSLLNSLQAIG